MQKFLEEPVKHSHPDDLASQIGNTPLIRLRRVVHDIPAGIQVLVKAGILPDGEMFFHSDTCYVECPAMASMLYAMEIPSRGGNTLYANGFRAYETLPADIKELLTRTEVHELRSHLRWAKRS